jgi:molybdopterin/thiamine biosynthesis adenylyltransferase
VTVVGLGSLGSYFCDNLCKLENIKKLVIVDYDTVQQKNLKLSPYRKEDIGKAKVDALEKLIQERSTDIKVVKFNEKFEEGVTKLPKTDLVIDCRDFAYDRKDLIDARLSISSRYLLVDCRKSVEYRRNYVGTYPLSIERKDVIDAAEFAGSLVRKNLIEKMIEKQKVYAIELDYLETMMSRSLNQLTKRKDILFDVSSKEIERFSNLLDCIDPIIFMNKLSRVVIYVGNKKFPVSQKTFPKNTFKSFNDVISILITMINPLDYKNYVILVNERSRIIELIAEQAVA